MQSGIYYYYLLHYPLLQYLIKWEFYSEQRNWSHFAILAGISFWKSELSDERFDLLLLLLLLLLPLTV